jgi:glucosamine--fructose-6-phosphate aminotransferase (isomerizing)
MTFMLKEIQEQPAILRKALIQNRESCQKIIEELNRRHIRGIMIAARGTSDHVAVFVKYIAEYYLRLPVSLAASSIANIYHRDIDLSDVLTIAISQSGEGPDVIGIVEGAKRANSFTVGITNHSDSSLAKIVDFALDCHAGPEKSVAATKTCTSSMLVAAAFIQEWARDYDLHEQLQASAELVEKIIARQAEIEKLAIEFGGMEQCVVLARGFNYGAALETALKIQETCYINARGYSVADFLHGPVAMIEKGFPVMIYAFNGPTLPGIVEVIHRLRYSGAAILLVTNEKTLLDNNLNSFYIDNEIPEAAAPFVSIVFGQLFAHRLALSKGYNPDLPRGLRKVTQTI